MPCHYLPRYHGHCWPVPPHKTDRWIKCRCTWEQKGGKYDDCERCNGEGGHYTVFRIIRRVRVAA